MILYSQPGCPQCKMVHMMLDKEGIQYEECQDYDEMQKVGIQHTPALNVDGNILMGRDLFAYIKNYTK